MRGGTRHSSATSFRRATVIVRAALVTVALVIAVAVTGAGPSRSEASAPGATPTHGAPPAGTSGAPGTPGERAAEQVGQPVLAGPLDWGDPMIVASGSTYYLYSTQPLPWVNVPVEVGGSGGTWGPVHDALPVLPAWAQSGQTWSPDVHEFGGQWVLYFAARLRGVTPAVLCIGDAVADTPTGPFLAAATPLICQRSLGGSIDPRVSVTSSGSTYLVWKSDNNADRAEYGTPVIWSQQLTDGGLGLVGSPTRIFTPDRAWQDALVEAPDLVTAGGRTWLFYSAGAGFWSADYAIGVARCEGPLGPCVDTGDTPLVASTAESAGPGEESVFSSGGHYWLVFNSSFSAHGSTARPVAIDALTFGKGIPVVSP